MDFLEKFTKSESILDIPSVEVKEYAALVQDLKDQPQRPLMSTGYGSLDAITGGFQGGELIILSAPTKQGKTTLAQTISWNMGIQGVGTLWFSYEMSWQELTRKFMAMDTQYLETQTPSIMPILVPIEPFKKTGDLQLDWMREIIKANRHLVNFIIVDHLHFLLPLKDYKQNISFLIGGLVREIKQMAIEFDIPILLIAHMKKFESDVAPDLSAIRDSSFIAQESDYAILMWKIRNKNIQKKTYDDEESEDIYTNKVMVSVETNRRTGKTGKVKMIFENNYLRDMTDAERAYDRDQKRMEEIAKKDRIKNL